MGKAKTFARRKVSSKNTKHRKARSISKEGKGIEKYDPTSSLLNEERIGRAIWECLKQGDAEGVIEVIQIHLEARNKTHLAKKAKIPKTTLYHSFKSKNPTLKTLAKIVQASI